MKGRAALVLVRRRVRLLCCIVVGILFTTGCDSRSHRESSAVPQSQARDRSDITKMESNKALRDAALDGRTQQVRLELKQGADVNAPGAEGRTPLMLAAFNGHKGTIELLLERGARVAARDAFGRTALMYSASGPYPESVQALLDHGADPDSRDAGEHWTPLMFAAAEGQTEVVQALLNHGADFAATDDDGETALDFARKNGHAEVVRLLETATREVDQQN